MSTFGADQIARVRKLAGMAPGKLTTYYNLAGPDKNKAAGRLNGSDKFVVPMDETEYRRLEESHTPEECYRILHQQYCEED